LPTSGLWRVYARWIVSSNHAPRSLWTVEHADGTASLERDQRVNGGVWNELGVYRFVGGEVARVSVSDANGPYAIADAVRYEWVGPSP
jgi:hypothetical protein